ncbi:MAG: SUMF1/EgtB/PvdO family nonheme iron enzyme [Bacteroidia bacterium]|nr:SUMF1/EgtB/PvdO family nonheme iron enzyme [Bacteroidia bacterium]
MNHYSAIKIQFTLMLISLMLSSFSNNIQIDNTPYCADIDASNQTTNIVFDISWENSWRVSAAPSNWDAAWIFAKYQKQGQTTWSHAYLSTIINDHSITTTNGVDPEFNVGITQVSGTDRGMGVFLYRASDGTGSINWDGVKLKWCYGANGLSSSDLVTIQVFAVEVVYIPQCGFYVGDGTAANVQGQFSALITTNPFQITNENSITLGGFVNGNLGNRSNSGMNTNDDFDITTTQTLPAAFPKGYNSFYVFKYEITQEQYAGFLNTLNGNQQATRISAVSAGKYMRDNNTSAIPQNRNGVRCKVAPVGATPGEYGNDFNNNGVYGEVADGQNIACNWLSWGDGTAYTDWCGMRPMSELEYEKICRGPNAAVADEYAWGTAAITQCQNISNSGAINEICSTGGANCIYNNAPLFNGPMRVGNFATGTSTRAQAGASYYGVMEMSGNLFERCVSIGSASGRNFTGTHGNGELSVAGNSTNSDWPAPTTAIGGGFRGGNLYNDGTYSRISSRYGANDINGFKTIREYFYGFRCVRSCTPPSISNAGTDQLNIPGTSTTLAANTPVNGTCLWSIVSGTGGSVTSPSDPASEFTGISGASYTLRWTITTNCGVSVDNVIISFQ